MYLCIIIKDKNNSFIINKFDSIDFFFISAFFLAYLIYRYIYIYLSIGIYIERAKNNSEESKKNGKRERKY